MARAWVTGPRERTFQGDNLISTWNVDFFGADMPNGPDSDVITTTFLPTDGIAAADDKVVDAVMAIATAKGYPLARTRVGFPATKRGT